MYGAFTAQSLLGEFGSFTYTDVDVVPPPPQPQHLVLFNVQNRQGTWEFTNDGSTWAPIPLAARGATSSSYMVLEDATNHEIRYRPNANYFTTGSNLPSLSVRAWDRAEPAGTVNTGGTILVSALTGDQSSETEGSVSENSGTLRLTINSINDDRPELLGIADIAPDVDEDNTYGPFTMQTLLTAFGATYMDTEGDSENLVIYNVQNRQGRWQYRAGWSWSNIPGAAQGATYTSFMVMEARSGHQIRYVPDPNTGTASASDRVSLSVRAWDNVRRRSDHYGRDDSGQCVNRG